MLVYNSHINRLLNNLHYSVNLEAKFDKSYHLKIEILISFYKKTINIYKDLAFIEKKLIQNYLLNSVNKKNELMIIKIRIKLISIYRNGFKTNK